jgi:CBS domain-containing protein
MKVREVMRKSPTCCASDTNIGDAANIMWRNNCSFLPLLNPEQKVVGVLTDRDMCIALATRNILPDGLTAQRASSGAIYSCKLEDDLDTALETMSERGIRRLPVLDAAGKLAGIFSIEDLVLHADSGTDGSLSSKDVVRLLKKLYSSQLALTQGKAASA